EFRKLKIHLSPLAHRRFQGRRIILDRDPPAKSPLGNPRLAAGPLGVPPPPSTGPVRGRQSPAPESVAADRPHQRPLRALHDLIWSIASRRAGVQGPCSFS